MLDTKMPLNPADTSSENCQMLVNAIPHGLLQVSKNGEIRFINDAAAKIINSEATLIVGKNIADLSSDLADIIKADWCDISIEAKESSWMDIYTRFPDNPPMTLQANIKRISDEDNSDRLLTMVDISSKKYIDEKKQRLLKIDALGTLAGGVAHEYNNLLMVVGGYIQRAKKRDLDEDRRADALIKAQEAVDRAVVISKQLLIFSGKHAREHKKTNLSTLLKNAKGDLKAIIPDTITLNWEITDEHAVVLLDPIQFLETVTNLTSNAVDATLYGGEVTIGLQVEDMGTDSIVAVALDMKPGRYVNVYVKDHGTGIDASTMDNMFDPFFSTKTHKLAPGLGLAVVYGFVKETGGYINVLTALEQGTEMQLYFPLEAGAEEKARAVTGDLPLGNGEVILVVDDEEGILAIIVDELEAFGYTVLSACGGIEALEIESEFEDDIDLLLSDVMMPGFTGPETARALLEQRPNLKLIFMSGYAPQKEDGRAKLPDGAAFLAKPVEPATLAQKVKDVLSQERSDSNE